ncbi:MAG: RimK family alpha-L-glutamate ligase, partial [Archangium sp.]|nr:RimK family alpha-L-glutamate ligase [Archangium sp.]
MHVILLSRAASIPSTSRLIEAAKARGHQVRVLNPLELELHLDSGRARVLHHRNEITPVDVVIPRIASSIASYGLPVVEQFSMQGVAVLNSAASIGQSRNPARCLQALVARGLAIPSTVLAREPKQLKAMVDQVGGVPV